jgi:hypothetical protein
MSDELQRENASLREQLAKKDAEIERLKHLAASMPKMPSARSVGGRFEQMLREIETAPQDRPELPGPTRQVITEADFARVAAERKQGK